MTDDSNITTRTAEKSWYELSFRDWYRKIRGETVEKDIGLETTIPYDTVDYVCQSCDESISPELDDFENWGKCPHCENRHPSGVKNQAGVSNLFGVLGFISAITIIGVLVAPAFFLLGGHYSGKVKDLLRDETNRIGQFVDENGEPVPEMIEYVRDGWVVKTQTANGFEMKRTDWGSKRMHWILAVTFCWTLGWANVIYGFVKMDDESMAVLTN